MAEIVLGIGTSHTPQISMGVENWPGHVASWDEKLPGYHEASELAPDWLREDIAPARLAERYELCQTNLERLKSELEAYNPDVVLVFGDDQEEMFQDDGTPTIALFDGSEIFDVPGQRTLSPSRQAAEWAFHGETIEPIATSGDISSHLAAYLAENDVSYSLLHRQPEGRSVGHAFTFIHRRLATNPRWKMIPIWLNTYYPPNQVSAHSAFDLGVLIRDAIEAWPGDERVAIVASGGLSHFYVDEELDLRVLGAFENHDFEYLRQLPSATFQSGTSEILNWIAAAGALSRFDVSWSSYVPAYRSLASTGVGVAAQVWLPATSI